MKKVLVAGVIGLCLTACGHSKSDADSASTKAPVGQSEKIRTEGLIKMVFEPGGPADDLESSTLVTWRWSQVHAEGHFTFDAKYPTCKADQNNGHWSKTFKTDLSLNKSKEIFDLLAKSEIKHNPPIIGSQRVLVGSYLTLYYDDGSQKQLRLDWLASDPKESEFTMATASEIENIFLDKNEEAHDEFARAKELSTEFCLSQPPIKP